ncbi:MAG: helix-turn-helix domain-containing protein [Bacteroidota bacterium]|nr:helix-turn-helix domain-containing protein [Bacteroidota bacterium]
MEKSPTFVYKTTNPRMFRFHEIPPEGDPSSRIQEFQEILPRLLCCRYWWMSEWKSQQMSFPYWRLYWNRSGRAWVVYNKTIYLEPDKLILIPPNTPFASDIDYSGVPSTQPYSLKGGRVENAVMEEARIADGTVLHMFIHFTLGYPFDTITPDIFVFDITPGQQVLIHSITRQLISGQVRFEQTGSLELYSLIFSLLHQLPSNAWKSQKLDERVLQGIRHMEQNISEAEIRNSQLAAMGGMSVNAYARLFKDQTGYSPRKYLLRMRVEKACNLLHHSELSIEQVASACGFSDRYYFTRIFTQTMKVSPGAYKKNSISR